MPERIFIVGAFHEIIELAEECEREIIGLIDSEQPVGRFDYPVLCHDNGIEQMAALLEGAAAVLTPDSPDLRQRLHQYYSRFGFAFASLISPGARVAKSASLGQGLIMHAGAQASAGSRIGNFVRLNFGAMVMHDAVIGDYSTIAPNAVVLGRVRVGAGCYIGANATVLPGIHVGEHAIVGAGAVVTKDVTRGTVVAGNPARVIRNTEPTQPPDPSQ